MTENRTYTACPACGQKTFEVLTSGGLSRCACGHRFWADTNTSFGTGLSTTKAPSLIMKTAKLISSGLVLLVIAFFILRPSKEDKRKAEDEAYIKATIQKDATSPDFSRVSLTIQDYKGRAGYDKVVENYKRLAKMEVTKAIESNDVYKMWSADEDVYKFSRENKISLPGEMLRLQGEMASKYIELLIPKIEEAMKSEDLRTVDDVRKLCYTDMHLSINSQTKALAEHREQVYQAGVRANEERAARAGVNQAFGQTQVSDAKLYVKVDMGAMGGNMLYPVAETGLVRGNPQDQYYVLGKLKNIGSKAAHVSITIGFYDLQNNLIDTGYDSVDLLSPGETYKFQVGPANGAGSFKIKQVESH
jgi:hypothetical protein